MQVTFDLELEDWRANERFWKSKRSRRTGRDLLWVWMFCGIVATFTVFPLGVIVLSFVQNPAFAASWRAQGLMALAPVSFVLIPLGFLAALWFGAPLLQKFSFRESPSYGRQFTLVLERDGLRGDHVLPWSQMQAIEETPQHIFILDGDNRALIIPKRAFESDFAANQFAAKCRDARQNAS